MVDSTAPLHPSDATAVSRSREMSGLSANLSFRVEKADSTSLASYEQFAAQATAGVPQQGLWVRSWIEATATEAIVVTMLDQGQPVLALALETATMGSMRVGRYIGGTHANANFPAIRTGYRPDASAMRDGLIRALAGTKPSIDALFLERQIDVLDHTPNPLLELSSRESANIGLQVSLTNGFEGVLEKHNTKRRMKKHRYQIRKFDEAGGFRIITASNPEETRRLLHAFFDLKTVWFREQGVNDVFAGEATHRFFETLFQRALDEKHQPYFLEALEVGGKLRAITGLSKDRGRVVCQFGSIANDELIQYSPGEFLTFHSIKKAIADGCTVYDYGIGDEPYKRMWCDEEVRYFDTVLGLTAKGRLLAGTRSIVTALKRQVKSRPGLFGIVKLLRRQRAQLKARD